MDLPNDEAERLDNQLEVFGKTFNALTLGCARCHGAGHEDVWWQTLTHTVEFEYGSHAKVAFTHWAPCPTNGEPILMRVDA